MQNKLLDDNSINILLYLPITSSFNKNKNKKRIITSTKKWNFTYHDLNNQYDIILQLYNNVLMTNTNNIENRKDEIQQIFDEETHYKYNFIKNILYNFTSQEKFIIQQIKQKLSSYKSQDKLKRIYDENNFAKSFQYILKLLYDCKLKCFYCKNITRVIYENVYESTQWTLERIDNNIGHNFYNICISCLKCNIGRRTMHQQRYLFTKKCDNIVIFEGKEPDEIDNT